MTWKEICKKYKDSELMKEFEEHFRINVTHVMIMEWTEIKDIWGYLIVFAETKDWYLALEWEIFADKIANWNYDLRPDIRCIGDKDEYYENDTYEPGLERSMLSGADKFFEVV